MSRLKSVGADDKKVFSESFNVCWKLLMEKNYYTKDDISNMMINLHSEPCSNIFNYYGNEMYNAMLKILDKIISSNTNHIIDASNKTKIGENSEPTRDHKSVNELKQSQNMIRKPMMKLNLNTADSSTISKKKNFENSSHDQSAHSNAGNLPGLSDGCAKKRLKTDELPTDSENITANYVKAIDKSNNLKPNKKKTNKPPAVYLNRVRPRSMNFQPITIKQEKLEPVETIETEISTKIVEQNNNINNTNNVIILKDVIPDVDPVASYETPVKIENNATILENQETMSADISLSTSTTSVISKDICDKSKDHNCQKKKHESSSLDKLEKSCQKLNETSIDGKVLRLQIDKIPLKSTIRRTRSSYYDKNKAHSSIPGYEEAIKSDKINRGRKRSNLNNSKENDKIEMKKIIPVEKYIKSENIVTSNCMPSYEEKEKIVEMAQKNPTWTLEMLREKSGVKKGFYRAHINKWADEIKYGGSRSEKLKAIDHYVLKKCIEQQKKRGKISNNHIREWGFEARSQMNAENFNFMASKSWLGRLKKRYNITGTHTNLKIDYKLCNNTETSISKIIEPKVNIVQLNRKNSTRNPKTNKKIRKENLENRKTDRLKTEVKKEEPQEEDECKGNLENRKTDRLKTEVKKEEPQEEDECKGNLENKKTDRLTIKVKKEEPQEEDECKGNLKNKKTDRLKIEVKKEEPQEEDESRDDKNWIYNKCIEYKKNMKGITNVLFQKWQRDDEIEIKTEEKSQSNTKSWTSWFNGSK